MVSGATGSGKTRWVFSFLKAMSRLYTENPPTHVLYCYGIYQDLYDDIQRAVKHITFHQGPPTQEDLVALSQKGSHGLVILDDLMSEVSNDRQIEKLFTQGTHHLHLSVIYIVQNVMYQNRHSRTISLNTQYMVLFKNYRDPSQIFCLARQIYPRRPAVLMDAYDDATSPPFGYLVVDLHPRTLDDRQRLQTGIFPGETRAFYQPLP